MRLYMDRTGTVACAAYVAAATGLLVGSRLVDDWQAMVAMRQMSIAPALFAMSVLGMDGLASGNPWSSCPFVVYPASVALSYGLGWAGGALTRLLEGGALASGMGHGAGDGASGDGHT